MHRCDDLRQMAVDQLENLALDCAKEEFGYRFGSHDDAKAKSGMRSSLRRQIARISTVLAEKQRVAALHEAQQKAAMKIEPVKTEPVKTEPAKKEAAKKESAQKDAVAKDSVNQEAAKKEAVKKEAESKQTAKKDSGQKKDAGQKSGVAKKS